MDSDNDESDEDAKKNPVENEVEPELILVEVDKGLPQLYPEIIEGQQNQSHEMYCN